MKATRLHLVDLAGHAGALFAVALCAALIAGCGGVGAIGIGSSSTPPPPASALDPAAQVPAHALVYMSVAVRPEGTLRQDLVGVADALGGPNAASELSAKLTGALASKADGAWNSVQPWLGQRVGLALVALPPAADVDSQSLLDNVVLVIPTNDPAAANSFLSGHLPNNPNLTYRVAGNYAYVGGAYAVQAASGLTDSRSLAASRSYRRLMAKMSGTSLFSAYVRERAIGKFMVGVDATQGLPQQELSFLRQSLKRPQATTVAISLALSSNTVSFETADAGPALSAATSTRNGVASLPGSSWLAVAFGGVAQNSAIRFLQSTFKQSLSSAATANPTGVAAVRFYANDLLPALGPMTLSISGTSKSTMRGGFALSPPSQAAGDRLLAGVEKLIGKRHTQVKLGHFGSQLVATLGYSSFAALLSPHRTLASDPAYRLAVRQLPRHSTVDGFVNFAPINALMQLDHNPKDAGAKRALSHLQYVVMGSGQGSFRLELKLK